MSAPALAQDDAVGQSAQSQLPPVQGAAPQQNEQPAANATNLRDAEQSASVPVSERTLEGGTVILPADHLFGDWNGRLPAWQESGFTPSLTWISNIAGNPVGGGEQGFTECENLGLDLSFDLEKLVGVCDTKFHVSMSQRSGTSLTNDYIGNFFSTQQVFGGETYKLINFDVQRYFFDRTVDVRLGRIGAADDFLVSPYFWYFMSNGIDGSPASIYTNAPGMTSYPNDTWGGRVKWATTSRTYAMFGVYNGDPNIRDNVFHGTNFSMHGPLFAIGEVGYQRNGHADDQGMLGNYKLGAYYNGGSFDEFSPSQFAPVGPAPGVVSGNWGYYALFDQVVYQPYGKDDPRAIGVFGSIVVAPDPSTNLMPFFCNGGVLARGLLPSRPTDTLGLGIIYGSFSPDLQAAQETAQSIDPTIAVQDYELDFELSYRIRMRGGAMFFQPDLQYIVNPDGGHQYPNALVVGAQMGVNF
jgi:porin